MPDLDPRDLLRDWQAAVQSLVESAASATGQRELPRHVLAATQRQLELMEELLHREQRAQRELAARAFAPLDAVFDLLEQSGTALRRQAEALKESARATEQAAAMIEVQADVFERALHVLRQPSKLAKSVAGVERQPPPPRRR
jgi:hypothetical protein